ncbi:MAG: hypothetical protein KGN77_06705 [Xanthomonadaceae bacterium]|nr:hypothetical protein [Xanthomonadaceae bacterium]
MLARPEDSTYRARLDAARASARAGGVAAQWSQLQASVIRIVGLAVGILMASGAASGALATMLAAVAAHARDTATLHGIGFRGVPVVVSVLLGDDAAGAARRGGVLCGLVARRVFNGYTASALGSKFSPGAFQRRLSPLVPWTGLKWALAIGFVGAVFPALRAAGLAVTVALPEHEPARVAPGGGAPHALAGSTCARLSVGCNDSGGWAKKEPPEGRPIWGDISGLGTSMCRA